MLRKHLPETLGPLVVGTEGGEGGGVGLDVLGDLPRRRSGDHPPIRRAPDRIGIAQMVYRSGAAKGVGPGDFLPVPEIVSVFVTLLVSWVGQ